MISEIQIEVTQEHTDELGHLNNVKAMEYLQSGRLDYYRLCGLKPSATDDVFGAVVVNVNINFRKECFLGECLKVQTQPVSIGNKSFVVAQKILRPDGQVALDGIVTSVVMEMRTRTLITVPGILAEHFPPRSNP
jgi:acyl-CoA thioester hydrolase/thioesterase-3